MVLMFSNTPYEFLKGNRIAQLMLLPYMKGNFKNQTRGDTGFGSTGRSGVYLRIFKRKANLLHKNTG